MSQNLIEQIERYAAETRLSPATITTRAAGNSQLYRRLKAGGSCTIRIAEKLKAYMESNPPSQPAEDGAK